MGSSMAIEISQSEFLLSASSRVSQYHAELAHGLNGMESSRKKTVEAGLKWSVTQQADTPFPTRWYSRTMRVKSITAG